MRARRAVVMCALSMFVAYGHVHVAGATPVSKPAFLVHPNDGYIYRPEDAAFIDSTHLLLAYSRGDNTSASIVGAGQFFRVYNTSSDAFSGEVDLNGIPESAFRPIAVAGRNGRGRIAYLSPRNSTSSTENDLWLLAVGTDGNLVDQPVRVSPFNTNVAAADVALLEDGTSLVVWWSGATPSDPRRLRIYGRRFSADLTPVGSEFAISDSKDVDDSDHIRAAFPRVDAGSYFNVVFDARPSGADTTSHVVVVSLNADGTERWRTTTVGTLASVATLDNDSFYVAFSADGVFDDQEDTFAMLVSPDGTPGSPYRLPLPRRGSQRLPEVAVHKGAFAAVAYGGARSGAIEDGDSVDFTNLDFTGAPLDADPPLIDNSRLGILEAVGNQRVVVAASSGDAIALLYNAEQISPNGPAIGTRAKMMLLRAGAPECPLTDQSQCTPLVPFHITGSAAHRINVVIRPSGYPGPDGRVSFLRQLRDHVVTETYYGASQHRTRVDRFNFLYELVDAQIPMSNPSFFCPEPINYTDFAVYQTRYPWVRAVGAQLDPALYYDSVTHQPKPPMAACADIDFANGGGSFFYFAYAVGVMEHEMSHALYHEPDEYRGGGFLMDPAPFPSQYLTLSDCQADASASGWNPNDCYLACDATVDRSCGKSWYSAELRPSVFPTPAECNQWVIDHGLLSSDYPCSNIGSVDWHIPGLNDLMVSPDIRTPDALPTDPLGHYVPANDVAAFRTVGLSQLEPAPSLQRACERRALYVLDNPVLTTSATTTSAPRILVMATVDNTALQATSASVLSAELGPTWTDFGPIGVTGLDSDGNQLSQASRPDPRLQLIEGVGSVSAPNGKPVAFQVPIVAGLRRVRVSEPTQSLSLAASNFDQREHVLLDLDLGPTLVSACSNGQISHELCATFDSDGDGCKDVVDPEPLVPETEPPQLTASVSPARLTPRNHKLQDVTVTLSAHDNCTPNPRIALESITSSEPESLHPGDPSPDIAGAAIGSDDNAFQLRAETYSSSGRVYTIVYSATDKVGNATRSTVTVEVPHDER